MKMNCKNFSEYSKIEDYGWYFSVDFEQESLKNKGCLNTTHEISFQ